MSSKNAGREASGAELRKRLGIPISSGKLLGGKVRSRLYENLSLGLEGALYLNQESRRNEAFLSNGEDAFTVKLDDDQDIARKEFNAIAYSLEAMSFKDLSNNICALIESPAVWKR